MNPFPEGNIPYIMGSYDYYPEAAGVFSFNGDGSVMNHGPNDTWFALPQPVYANGCDNFVFDSNPHMVSVAGDAPNTVLDNRHYDNPVNISSWISTASPDSYVPQPEKANAVPEQGIYPSTGTLPTLPRTFPFDQDQLPATTDQIPSAGYFGSIPYPNLDHSSPMRISSRASFFTPYGRNVSTSTSASSCPGTSSTLATPCFDHTVYSMPSQVVNVDPSSRKASWPYPVTPESSDVFTSVPLAPPRIVQPLNVPRPAEARMMGQSPDNVTLGHDQYANLPRLSANGRSLRSTPSIESLQDFAEEQDNDLRSSGPQTLLSPFTSVSMNRTCSAPSSFLAHRLEASNRRQSRQTSDTWSSPFTSQPLSASSCAAASENRKLDEKAVKRKPSLKILLGPSAMSRSLTANEMSSSPMWTAWLPNDPSKTLVPMVRSASAQNSTYASTGIGTVFAPGTSTGWTSQVPQPKRSEVGLQAVKATRISCTDAFTTIPASAVPRPSDDPSPFSSEPRNLTVPGTATPRKTKKLPKRAQGNTSGVKLTFMNFGPDDGDQITNAVAESGKSKRRRPDDSSSGDENLAVMKRSKSSASAAS